MELGREVLRLGLGIHLEFVLCVGVGGVRIGCDGLSDRNVLSVICHFSLPLFLEILVLAVLHQSSENDYNPSSFHLVSYTSYCISHLDLYLNEVDFLVMDSSFLLLSLRSYNN